MKNEKLKKADALLDAVGEIDDAYLAQALAYRKKRGVSSRLAFVAAAIAMTVTLIFSVSIGLRLVSHNDLAPSAPGNENSEDKGASTNSLESLMLSLPSKDSFTHVENEADLPYTGGKAYVVWQYKGESGYYLSDAMSNFELGAIKSQIGGGKEVGADSPTLECKVWILLGDGRVVTPYLKGHKGNISSRVFDYEAEITPDEDLVERISAILS